jgi:hypothetical protein
MKQLALHDQSQSIPSLSSATAPEPTAQIWGILVCIFVATALTAWLTVASVHIESLHLANHGFFYDPASYLLQHINLYRACGQDGAFNTLVHELSSNSRCLLRTAPYLVAPETLKSVLAHLWTEVPFLWLFLALVTTTTYARTKSLLASIAPAAIFAGFPFLYNPQSGIGAFWLDLTASLAMGSAGLCLIRYAETKTLKWMLLFGLFASATALSRWSAASYLLIYALIAFPLSLAHQRFSAGAALKAIGCALLTALPGLVYTIYWFRDCTSYYAHSGYALGSPLLDSLSWAFKTVQTQIGSVAFFTLLGLTALHLVRSIVSGTNRRATFMSAWLPVAVVAFVCVICRAVEAYHALFYMAPAIVVSAFTPISREFCQRHRTIISGLAGALIIGSSFLAYDSYSQAVLFASAQDAQLTLRKKSDVAMANFIAQTHAVTFIEFDTQTIMPHLEAFYLHGVYCLHPHWFSVHPFHFTGLYPGKTVDQVAVRNYHDVARDLALVAVFHNPDQALEPGVFNNPYSQKVSQYVSEQVPKEKQWKFLGSVETPNGLLDVYQNKAFRGSGIDIEK